MNAFAQIVQSCAFSPPEIESPPTKIHLIRAHLQRVSKASAAELAEAAGISSQDIRSSLNHDIRNGKVRITNAGVKQGYLLVTNPPPDKRTLKAIAFLTGQGYVVQEPADVPA